ncbi:MAG: hypothetical protein ACTTH5_02215 [Wolinella sp.]
MSRMNPDYLSVDYEVLENELDALDKNSGIKAHKIEINRDLEVALQEFEELRSQLPKEQTATLLELCKDNVLSTITSQFGLASLLVDARDGGNVTTVHNFSKGVTANESDAAKYNDMMRNRNDEWSNVRKRNGYDKPLRKIREETFKSQNSTTDAYTGKTLSKDRAHSDHVVPVKEIESSVAANLALSPEERVKIATNEQNLAWTDGSINQSKSSDTMDDFLNRTDKKTGQSQAEKLGIDKERAKEIDNQSRKYIYGEINAAKFKKYSRELLQTGGKDAAKMVVYSAIGIIMRDLMQGIMIELRLTFDKKRDETLKEIFNRFKHRVNKILLEVKSKWKEILDSSLQAGVTAFLSNIVVFVINLFATTLKRFVAIIRAGFVSLVEAIKILANPPAGISKDEINYQALKVLTAGLIGALSLGLTEGIEKLLLSVPLLTPIMSFPLPFGDQTVSDAIAVTLSAICGGLLTTVALYFMDKAQAQTKESKLQIQLMAKSGEIVHLKVAQTWCVLGDAYTEFSNDVRQSYTHLGDVRSEIEQSSKKASESVGDFSQKMEDLKFRLKKL